MVFAHVFDFTLELEGEIPLVDRKSQSTAQVTVIDSNARFWRWQRGFSLPKPPHILISADSYHQPLSMAAVDQATFGATSVFASFSWQTWQDIRRGELVYLDYLFRSDGCVLKKQQVAQLRSHGHGLVVPSQTRSDSDQSYYPSNIQKAAMKIERGKFESKLFEWASRRLPQASVTRAKDVGLLPSAGQHLESSPQVLLLRISENPDLYLKMCQRAPAYGGWLNTFIPKQKHAEVEFLLQLQHQKEILDKRWSLWDARLQQKREMIKIAISLSKGLVESSHLPSQLVELQQSLAKLKQKITAEQQYQDASWWSLLAGRSKTQALVEKAYQAVETLKKQTAATTLTRAAKRHLGVKQGQRGASLKRFFRQWPDTVLTRVSKLGWFARSHMHQHFSGSELFSGIIATTLLGTDFRLPMLAMALMVSAVATSAVRYDPPASGEQDAAPPPPLLGP